MKVGELFVRMAMDTSQFDKDERAAKARVQTLGGTLSGVLKNAFSFTLGMGFFQAVQAGFRSTVGTMIGFNAQMEQAQIGFTTMLGSAQRAQKFLDDVANFAAKTPFEFPDLLDASKRMLAYGFAAEDVLPTMQAVGNATAAVGLGSQGIDRIILALGQMRAKGKVSGEEMRQLTETGIPAWEILAEAMGKSTAEVMDLSQRGLIPADRAIKMFTEGMNKRFPDMMSKMENTWEGVTSTIRDVWRMTIGEVTKGLFQGAVSWLQKVRDVATGFYDAFRAGGLSYAIEQTFGARAAASIGTLTAALKGLWGMVSGVARVIVRNWTLIRNLTLGVVWAFVSFKTASFYIGAVTKAQSMLALVTGILRGEQLKTTATTGMLSVFVSAYNKSLAAATAAGVAQIGVLRILQAAIHGVTAALGTLLWPLLIIGAVLGIGVSLWSKYNQAVQKAAQKAQMDKMAGQQKEYMDAVNKAAQGTGNQADALDEMGKAANKNLQSFDEVHTLMEETAAATLGGPALDAGSAAPAVPGIELPEMDFAFDLEAGIAEAKADMGGFWGWLKTEAAGAWGSVKEWAGNLWDGVKEKWGGFKTWLAGWWNEHVAPWFTKEKWLELYSTINTSLRETWDSAVTWWNSTALGKWWNEHVAPWFTKAKWIGLYNNMLTSLQETWTSVATWWQNTALSKWWNEHVAPWFTKEKWLGLYDNMSLSLQEIWSKIVTWWQNTALVKWWREHVAPWFTKAKWLELYAPIKTSLQDIWSDVEKWWNGTLLGKAFKWGRNLITNIVDGIDAGLRWLSKTVGTVGQVVLDFLGFSSPTRKGPGRDADKWAPNLMRMYAQGILANIDLVQDAASAAARSLGAMAATPAPAFGGARLAGVGAGGYAPSSMPQPEIHLHIGTLVADDYGLKKLERALRKFRLEEDQRIGDAQ